jgi:hypothetical protein
MTISELAPGQRFVLYGRDVRGTLVRLGVGSAVVDVERRTERQFTTAEGKSVRFTSTRERTTWSLATPVEVLP